MATSYKNIVITPNIGNTADPKIQFSGGNTSANTDITLYVYPNSNGSLSFEGSAGQLFSITNDLTGSIFSVNDVSGIPSIDVNANGTIGLAPYGGAVGIGTTSPTSGRGLTLNNSNNYFGIEFQTSGTTRGKIIQESTGNMYYDAGGALVFRSNGSTERMQISAAGDITLSANLVLGTGGLSANGGFGTAGQVLHSNGSATYWAADDNAGGTVTSVTGGTGLTGGTITTTGTLSVNAAYIATIGAATAETLTSNQSNWAAKGVISAVVGLLSWKNYSSGHVIFDASNGTSPSGGAINNGNAQVPWTGTYPTLMGWNGTNTYGVRVDSARVADTVGANTRITVGTTAPGSPSVGDLWVDTN